MSKEKHDAWYVVSRGMLIAQDFLLELGARFISTLEGDVGIDLLALFGGKDGITIIGVEVKATQNEIKERYMMSGSTLNMLKHSNIPFLIIVVDVKRTEVYFVWARDVEIKKDELTVINKSIRINMRLATSEEKEKLKLEIREM